MPRLAAASLMMGAVLFFAWTNARSLPHRPHLRRAAGLTALVGAGVAVYGLACFLTGAFVLDDVKLLMKRRAKDA